jgi:streptogramin lyase
VTRPAKESFVRFLAVHLACAGILFGGALRTAFAQPTLPEATIFNGVAVEEEGAIVFNVQLSQPSTEVVTVVFQTADIPPQQTSLFDRATAGLDYVPNGGPIVFLPGETRKQITVQILTDDVLEHNEAFLVLLVNATNAFILPPFAKLPVTTVIPGNPAFGKITSQALPFQVPATITEFELLPQEQVPSQFAHTGGMVFDRDRNIWSSAQFDHKIAMFNIDSLQSDAISLHDAIVDGVLVPGPLPPLPGSGFERLGLSGAFPHFITISRDGKSLWFTGLNDVIGTIDLATEEVRLFREGITPGSVPHAITQGPDGNIYFSEEGEEPLPEQDKTTVGQSRIARFDIATHEITEFTGGLPLGQRLHGFSFDVDGNLWASLEGSDRMARFDFATETFTDFVSFSEHSGPHGIYPGPPGDTNLYVVLQDANKIGVFNPRTRQVQEFDIPGLTEADGPSLVFYAAGPDGRSIWFTEFLNDRIGRFDTITHDVAEFFSGITPGSAPLAIALGPDGNMWFTEPVLDLSQRGRIGRIRLRLPNLNCPGQQEVAAIEEKICPAKGDEPAAVIQRVCCRTPNGREHCRPFQHCPRGER